MTKKTVKYVKKTKGTLPVNPGMKSLDKHTSKSFAKYSKIKKG